MQKEKKITIGVAEDNDIIVEMLEAVIENEEQFELVGRASNGIETMELIRQKQPDVMLLDMVMPQGGGLDVLTTVNEEKIEKTKFIVISAIGEERVAQQALALGAKYYIMKPFQAESIIRRIRLICDEAEQLNAPEAPKGIEHVITKTLLALGVPAQLNGYKYLRESISMVVINPGEVTAITRQIYPVIAEKYNASAASVERAIRHAIEVSWNRGNVEAIDKMFGYTINQEKGKPTNSEYIAMVADHIRMGYHF